MGQSVKDVKGQTLGSVYDITFNPETGDTFAVIGVGSGRYALVPWQAFTVTVGTAGQDELSLNMTLQDLQSGPTIASNQWEKLRDPAFVQSIYAQFKLQPQYAIGGTQSGELGGRSDGAGSNNTTETNRNAIAPP